MERYLPRSAIIQGRSGFGRHCGSSGHTGRHFHGLPSLRFTKGRHTKGGLDNAQTDPVCSRILVVSPGRAGRLVLVCYAAAGGVVNKEEWTMQSWQVQTRAGLNPQVITAVTARQAVAMWLSRIIRWNMRETDMDLPEFTVHADGFHVIVQ